MTTTETTPSVVPEVGSLMLPPEPGAMTAPAATGLASWTGAILAGVVLLLVVGLLVWGLRRWRIAQRRQQIDEALAGATADPAGAAQRLLQIADSAGLTVSEGWRNELRRLMFARPSADDAEALRQLAQQLVDARRSRR